LALALCMGLCAVECLPAEMLSAADVTMAVETAEGMEEADRAKFMIDQDSAPSMQNHTDATPMKMIATPPPPSPAQMALIASYMKKIKVHQEEQGQEWHPAQEEDLAEKLAFVDQVLIPTDEEQRMEVELRKPAGGLPGVEVDLKKYDQNKAQREAEEASAAASAASETKGKTQRKLDLQQEDKVVSQMIQKYRESSVDKKLEADYNAAVEGVKAAAKTEQSLKEKDSFKAFAKEYELDKPADKADDYPKEESLGENDHVVIKKIETVNSDKTDANDQTANLSDEQLDDTLSKQALKKLKALKKAILGA